MKRYWMFSRRVIKNYFQYKEDFQDLVGSYGTLEEAKAELEDPYYNDRLSTIFDCSGDAPLPILVTGVPKELK